MAFVNQELAETLRVASLFDDATKLHGEVFREVKTRRTLRFEVDSKRYFVKLHFGVGWVEIVKNLTQFRAPVLGAQNELKAIRKLQELGIDTMTPVAYVSEGANPAKIRSCIVTQALENTKSLEELVLEGKVGRDLRRKMIFKIAHIARTMHNHGINHRDFYICHFLIEMGYFKDETIKEPQLFLIDLHRAQIRDRTPQRWREKDISGLLFSGIDAGLTRTDLFRFMKTYSGRSLRETLSEDKRFWNTVLTRAQKLYLQDHGVSSPALDQIRQIWIDFREAKKSI